MEVYKNPLPYEVTLHKPGGGVIAELSAVIFDRAYNAQLGGADGFSFKIYKKIDGIELPFYDNVIGKNLIRVRRGETDLGFIEIQDVSENQEGEIPSKQVNALSAEIKLSRRRIYLTEGVFTLQNLVNEIVGRLSSWSVGEIDLTIANRSRYIDVVDQNIYEFILSTVQISYECIFDFDTVQKKINVYPIVDYGENTGIYLSYANLVNNLTLSDLTGEVVTKLYLYGDQEQSVRDINFGQDFIENYSFFKNEKWMSQGLIDALTTYEALIESSRATYSSLLATRALQETNLVALEASIAEKDGELTSLLSQEGFLIATSQSTSTIRSQIISKESELSSLRSQSAILKVSINATIDQLNALALSLSKESNFTEAQLDELDQFVFEEMFQDSTYSLSDFYDYEQKIAMQTELLQAGNEMLAQLSFPRVSVTMSVVDFLSITDFKEWEDKLAVGDKLYLDLGATTPVLRITGYSHNPDSNSLDITVGDKHSLDDATFQMLELLQQSINTGSTVSFERFKYKDYVNNSKNEILEFLNNSFDISQKKITSSTNQSYVWDESGLLFRRQEGGSFSPEQIKITNNAIALTKDGFNTVSTAIGQMPNGAYGVAAELLIGKVILGTNLQIEAGSNLMTMDENGIMATHTDQLRRVLINPADGIKIQTRANTGAGFTDKFSVDTVGNITFTGELRGTNFKSGTITGSSININNRFMVDSSGNMTATGATISGNITLAAGSSINWAEVTPPTAAQVGALPSNTYIPTVPSYITSTKITSTTIESPSIVGATIIGGQMIAGDLGRVYIGNFAGEGSLLFRDSNNTQVFHARYLGMTSEVRMTTSESTNLYIGAGFGDLSLSGMNASVEASDILYLNSYSADIRFNTLPKFNGQYFATRNWVTSEANIVAKFG
jgi:hypothetical protein